MLSYCIFMNSVYSMCPHDEHRAAVLFSAWPETKKDIRWTQRTAFASLCLCKFNLIKSSRDTHFAYGPYRISSASAQQQRTFCIICNHIECTKILSIVYAADKQTKKQKNNNNNHSVHRQTIFLAHTHRFSGAFVYRNTDEWRWTDG